MCCVLGACSPTIEIEKKSGTFNDVQYVSDGHEHNIMDVHVPRGTTKSLPLVIYISGEEFSGEPKERFTKDYASLIRSKNYIVAEIMYRPSPEVIFPASIHDAKAAIRFLKSEADFYKIDTSRIGVIGRGVGAYLASILGTSIGVDLLEGKELGHTHVSSEVHAIFGINGPSDFSQIDDYYFDSCNSSSKHNSSESVVSQYIGCNLSTCPDDYERASAISYVDGNEPPFLIVHGQEDCVISPYQGELLQKALTDNESEASLIIVPGAGHGSNFPPEKIQSLALRFFDQKLRGVNDYTSRKGKVPSFIKTTIDETFRSESIALTEINNDDYKDIVIGDVWYEGPNWEMHEIRKPQFYSKSKETAASDSKNMRYYSNSFAVQSLDVNKDGWQDVISFPVMGEPVTWYENPKNHEGHWKERVAHSSYHGESPLLFELNGSLYPLAGYKKSDQTYELGVLTPSTDLDAPWEVFTIGDRAVKSSKTLPTMIKKLGAPGATGHGLGCGDINGDGADDVLTRHGWYEAPVDTVLEHWTFHYYPFDQLADLKNPQYQFAQMPVCDIDGDGDNDIFGSSAHHYGVWWFEQVQDENGNIEFVKHSIPIRLSQVHAVAQADLNGNDIPDFIIGKRWLAHAGKDPGTDDFIDLLWIEPRVSNTGQVDFQIELLDRGVGVGTQIEIADVNLDQKDDLLISNKKGTYLYLQN